MSEGFEALLKPLSCNINGLNFGVDLFKEKPDLPERYIINEHVCVCHWKDGTITKSFKHESDVFNKKLGFLLCCFRHYNAKMSKNKQKKVISWIKYEYLEDYLFDMFVEKTKMTVKQAEAYIRDLKVEEPKQKPKHMKIDKIEKLKKFLQKNYPNIQAFNIKNIVGDYTTNVYDEDNIQVDYCSKYEYIEIFGLSDEEFKKLINDKDNRLKTFKI